MPCYCDRSNQLIYWTGGIERNGRLGCSVSRLEFFNRIDSQARRRLAPTSTKRASVTSKSASHPRRASAIREVGALSDLDNVSVRIADVAARLAVLGDRLRDELRSSTFP